jgi:hypothetical protein
MKPEVKRVPTAKSRALIREIGQAAHALGCSRQHLRLVLQGKRQGKVLIARYNALKTVQSIPTESTL